jgi:hypothetical protein
MSTSSANPALVRPRPWWLSPAPIGFGVVVLLACGAVLLQDVVSPPKPVDPRTKVVLPGGATFCDTVPQAPQVPGDSAESPASK